MAETSQRQFGFLIAYVLPGFITLVGLAPIFPGIARWLQPVPASQFDLGVGPPLYAILGATALGLVLSCVRWIVLDQIQAVTGVRREAWDDSQLDQVLGAFDYVVQMHFRYAEATGNMFVALLIAYGSNRLLGTARFMNIGTDLAAAVLLAILFVASRNVLKNYYTRTSRLVGRAQHAEKK